MTAVVAQAPEAAKLTRANAIATEAAKEVNDELTIILAGVEQIIEDYDLGEFGNEMLEDIQAATKRAAWKLASLLAWNQRQGLKPNPTALDILVRRDG